jgi:flagellar biosynthetic protein FliS
MAAANGGGYGLLIALYETLAGDLRRAAAAQQSGDIEKRCHEIKHALQVIGYLEHCVAEGPGGELAQQLAAFYSSIRRDLIEAQKKQSAEALERQMAAVLEIRESWQKANMPGLEPANDLGSSQTAAMTNTSAYATTFSESRYGGWSA